MVHLCIQLPPSPFPRPLLPSTASYSVNTFVIFYLSLPLFFSHFFTPGRILWDWLILLQRLFVWWFCANLVTPSIAQAAKGQELKFFLIWGGGYVHDSPLSLPFETPDLSFPPFRNAREKK